MEGAGRTEELDGFNVHCSMLPHSLFLKRRRLARPLLQLGAYYLGALTWSLNSFLSKGPR